MGTERKDGAAGVSANKSANTVKAYEKDVARFRLWCHEQQAEALPVSVPLLAQYLTHLIETGKRAETILRQYAAINHVHVLRGLESLTNDPHMKEVLQRLRAGQATRSRKQTVPTLRWRR